MSAGRNPGMRRWRTERVSTAERVRDTEKQREKRRDIEQVRGVLQDGGYKGWFRAREGCG